ncbi:hypothetical protein C0J52_21516 [Blattella germanica]|nr:hypothetical protein C0J52_21516 [Blattella germanica]
MLLYTFLNAMSALNKLFMRISVPTLTVSTRLFSQLITQQEDFQSKRISWSWLREIELRVSSVVCFFVVLRPRGYVV